MWQDVAAVVAAISTAHPETLEPGPPWVWFLWAARQAERTRNVFFEMAMRLL